MADSPAVLVERDSADPAVAVVTMNRPERHNALTVELKVALRDALVSVAGDDSVRAIVLTGSGRSFCVGQDLGEHAAALAEGAEFTTVEEHYNPIVLAMAEAPKPVIAAINGTCVGAGLGFALAADLRVTAAGATFATAFTGIGLTADSGLSATLAHMVGVARATGRARPGGAAPAGGPAPGGWAGAARGGAAAAALPAAGAPAGGPPAPWGGARAAARCGGVRGWPGVRASGGRGRARLVGTADHAGAVAAFLDKRKPTFEGR